MNDPHLIRVPEREGNCMYCSASLASEEWFSDFTSSAHYKCVVCKCGRQNCVKVDFMGTGHDTWSGLEEKVASSSVRIIGPKMKVVGSTTKDAAVNNGESV